MKHKRRQTIIPLKPGSRTSGHRSLSIPAAFRSLPVLHIISTVFFVLRQEENAIWDRLRIFPVQDEINQMTRAQLRVSLARLDRSCLQPGWQGIHSYYP
jgi:hypothetical protein